MTDPTTVQVALRIRPMVPKEIEKGCAEMIEVLSEHNQVKIKMSDKAFTYNHVFGPDVCQEDFYVKSVEPLLGNIFKGYNVTILAYGQTGSGKTHSMGTSYNGEEDMGIIPRAVNYIFNYIKDNFTSDFDVTVSFMELYQETLYDLLSPKSKDQSSVDIREDNKGIIIPGLTEHSVETVTETLNLLFKGSQRRATASTNMNSQSSRSHAIFTINIQMRKKGSSEYSKQAKFHLVDLAGSERSKKTGATGQTFKEGVNINKGLLALGNVISALGDEKGQIGYISYRDSNLTRLLKDSLGGNSITLMIACISPADYNMEETLSTLRYADRARKIKNKPTVNEDAKLGEINRLKKLVQQLQMELLGQGGSSICPAEVELIKKNLIEAKYKSSTLSVNLLSALNENAALLERILIMQTANEELAEKLNTIKEEYNITLENFNISLQQCNVEDVKLHIQTLKNIQSQFNELEENTKKNFHEVRLHERNISKTYIHEDPLSVTEINEHQEIHTAQQIALSSELQEVSKRLAQKELLAEQIASNTHNMVDLNEMMENEMRIATLEKEKDQLLQQLKTITANGEQSKFAAQRRKRVQELESELQALNKKLKDQARLIKLKEKDELKIRQLNNEMQTMKEMKVRLIKSMRQETEKFRTWKLAREKELNKLKNQDQKRQNQIVKMETIHNRQQNVLKRKVEEAAAINKRLKVALDNRKKVQDTKLVGKVERLGPWMKQEMDVFCTTVEAQASLEILLNDRASLTMHMNKLKQDPTVNGQEIEEFKREIDLRSLQIQEMQQKILSSDEENRSKSRFDNIQTMAEAKYAINYLFELTADIKKAEVSKGFNVEDLQHENSDLRNEIEKNKRSMQQTEKKHMDELTIFDREYEEKVAILLKQLRGIEVQGEQQMKQRCDIQSETIEKLEHSVATLTSEIEELKSKLSQVNDTQLNQTTVLKLNRHSNKENVILNGTFDKVATTPVPIDLDSSFDEDEDRVHDPDWKKTPLARRVNAMRKTLRSNNDFIKKSIFDGGCSCRGICTTKVCGCNKKANSCDDNCKCLIERCKNRLRSHEAINVSDSNDSTFKKPRAQGEYEPEKKKLRYLYAE